ncbi:MAG: hypothetical protein ABFS45_16730 [Pseudomonadota bacterium]
MYTLSKSNKIYFSVVAVLSFGAFVAMSEPTPYGIGRLTGSLIGYFLIPALIALIVWWLSGRKEKGGSWTFNIVLTLVILGQIWQFGDNTKPSQVLSEFGEEREKFKRNISSIEDPEELDDARDKYVDSIKHGFGDLSEASEGAQKQFYIIMNGYVGEAQLAAQKWKDSFNAAQSPRILDYSLLNSDEEFDYQRNVLNLYVENTKVYSIYQANSVPDLIKRLSVLEEENATFSGAVNGATEQYLAQKPIFEPLMRAHIEYGNGMIQMLDLLQVNKDMWSYENDELIFSDDRLLSQYNELVEVFSNSAGTINTLSSKLVDLM